MPGDFNRSFEIFHSWSSFAVAPRISCSPEAQQSQHALKRVFIWGGPGYCFLAHPPPLWTHTSSQCVEKFHEKNVHVHWRMSSSWENNIHLNSELWKPTFPSNAVYIKVCALCLCPSRGDDVLLLKIKIIIVRRNFLGNIFCPLTISSPVHKIQCQIPPNPVFHLLCYPSPPPLPEREWAHDCFLSPPVGTPL